MAQSFKVNPQVKVTCKQITPKLNIESIDKNTFNNLKKSITKYYLTVEVIDNYEGEIDEDGYAVDTNDYNTWRRNHPNKISKQSVNNIIKSIKNNSLVNWTFNGDFNGIGYNFSEAFFNGFDIFLLAVNLLPRLKTEMFVNLINIFYQNNVLSFDTLDGNFVSQ